VAGALLFARAAGRPAGPRLLRQFGVPQLLASTNAIRYGEVFPACVSAHPRCCETPEAAVSSTPEGPRMAESIDLAPEASRLASLLLSYVPAS